MRINVVSFNIRYKSDKNGHSIAERAPRIEKIVRDADADVIGFQEYTPAWEREVESRFGKDYGIFCRYRDDAEDVEASPILWRKSRFELVETTSFWLSDTPEVKSRGWDTDCTCYRMCVCAVLRERGTGEKLVLANTHFGFGVSCHEKSARLIADRLAEYKGLPVVLTGDFNMTSDEPAYAVLSSRFTDVNAVTIRDSETTFHGYDPEHVRDQHIDYIFVGGGVRPCRFEIVRDRFDGGKFPSDHYALSAELEL